MYIIVCLNRSELSQVKTIDALLGTYPVCFLVSMMCIEKAKTHSLFIPGSVSVKTVYVP